MSQLRITEYFRPVNEPGPSSPAPASAPARAPRPARGAPVAPELQARAPQPYSTQAPNRDHARVDLGAKFAAFSERMRREQTPPAPAQVAPAPRYVLSHMTQAAAEPAPATPPGPLFVLSHATPPAPPPAAEPAPATPPGPLFVLSHTTRPAPPPAAEPAPATPPGPLFVLSHTTRPAPTRAAEPAPATPPGPLFVLSHATQAPMHAPQAPLYYLNHNPHPVIADPLRQHHPSSIFGLLGRLPRLPNRLLPRRRRNGDI